MYFRSEKVLSFQISSWQILFYILIVSWRSNLACWDKLDSVKTKNLNGGTARFLLFWKDLALLISITNVKTFKESEIAHLKNAWTHKNLKVTVFVLMCSLEHENYTVQWLFFFCHAISRYVQLRTMNLVFDSW